MVLTSRRGLLTQRFATRLKLKDHKHLARCIKTARIMSVVPFRYPQVHKNVKLFRVNTGRYPSWVKRQGWFIVQGVKSPTKDSYSPNLRYGVLSRLYIQHIDYNHWWTRRGHIWKAMSGFFGARDHFP